MSHNILKIKTKQIDCTNVNVDSVRCDGIVSSKGNYDFINYQPGFGGDETIAGGTINYYESCAIGYNGNMYWKDRISSAATVFNPVTEVGPESVIIGAGSPSWYGMIGDSHYIYTSNNTNTLYRFDIDTNTTTQIANLGGNAGAPVKYGSKIYFAPFDATTTTNYIIRTFDVSSLAVDTTSIICTVAAVNLKSKGLTIGLDGKMYGAPSAINTIVIYDPVTNIIDNTTFSSISGGTWGTFAMGKDGKLYATANDTTSILQLDTEVVAVSVRCNS